MTVPRRAGESGGIVLDGTPQEVNWIVDEVRPGQEEVMSHPLESMDENLGDSIRSLLDLGKSLSGPVDHPGPAGEQTHRQPRRFLEFKSHSGDFSSGHVTISLNGFIPK